VQGIGRLCTVILIAPADLSTSESPPNLATLDSAEALPVLEGISGVRDRSSLGPGNVFALSRKAIASGLPGDKHRETVFEGFIF
jgi:hypothetical protein